MVTYYDALNYSFKRFELETPPASVQLVWLWLLQINNRLGNTGHVTVSDRQLAYMTGLNDKTITVAKQKLKNMGLIDFKSKKGKPTNYTIMLFDMGHLAGQQTGHKTGQSLWQSSRFNVVNLQIAKTEKEERAGARNEAEAVEKAQFKVMPEGEISCEWVQKKLAAKRANGI